MVQGAGLGSKVAGTVADRFFRPGRERKIVQIKEHSEKYVSHYSYGKTGGSLGKSRIYSKFKFLESEKTVRYCIYKKTGHQCKMCVLPL